MSTKINTVYTVCFCCYNSNQHSFVSNINNNIITLGILCLLGFLFYFQSSSWFHQVHRSPASQIFSSFQFIFLKRPPDLLPHATHLCSTKWSLFMRTLFMYFILYWVPFPIWKLYLWRYLTDVFEAIFFSCGWWKSWHRWWIRSCWVQILNLHQF